MFDPILAALAAATKFGPLDVTVQNATYVFAAGIALFALVRPRSRWREPADSEVPRWSERIGILIGGVAVVLMFVLLDPRRHVVLLSIILTVCVVLLFMAFVRFTRMSTRYLRDVPHLVQGDKHVKKKVIADEDHLTPLAIEHRRAAEEREGHSIPLTTFLAGVGRPLDDIFNPDWRSAVRTRFQVAYLLMVSCVIATIAAAGQLLSFAGGSKPGLQAAAVAWVSTAEEARKKSTVQPDASLPSAVASDLSAFDVAWRDAAVAEKTGMDQKTLYDALAYALKVNRKLESRNKLKPESYRWADQSVDYFREHPSSTLLAEAYCDRAELHYDSAQIHNGDKTLFRQHSVAGDGDLQKAFEAAEGVDQQAQVLRAWSRLSYNLARPPSGVLTDEWDPALLSVAEAKAKDAIRLKPDDLLGYTQWARCVQRMGVSGTKRNDAAWTAVSRDCLDKLQARWAAVGAGIRDADGRIPPLNILAVLGTDIVGRERDAAPQPITANKWHDQVNGFIAQQSEVKALLPNTSWGESYRFDVEYDLARMFCLQYQLAVAAAMPDTPAYWAMAKSAMQSAFRVQIDGDRRTAIRTDLDSATQSGLRGLPADKLKELKALLN